MSEKRGLLRKKILPPRFRQSCMELLFSHIDPAMVVFPLMKEMNVRIGVDHIRRYSQPQSRGRSQWVFKPYPLPES